MNSDDYLISKLIEETCKEDKEVLDESDSSKITELQSYFEKRVNQVEYISIDKYMIQQNLVVFKLKFLDTNKCFRLSAEKIILDFPSNWSVFQGFEFQKIQLIDYQNDKDLLCEVLSEVLGHCESIALVNDSGNYNMIVFKDISGKDHYEWFLNYFSKKEIDRIKKAS
jgi:hypothetical protein